MFEKEAEEFADSKNSFWRQGRTCIDSVRQAFQNGAEFGYNKANEWHYVKDELPNNTNICLLYLGSWYNPTTGWYDNNAWCFEDDRKASLWQDAVIAWKEIVLPKESKEK